MTARMTELEFSADGGFEKIYEIQMRLRKMHKSISQPARIK